jgi:hypothetical protein
MTGSSLCDAALVEMLEVVNTSAYPLCCPVLSVDSMIFMEPPPDYETAGEQQVSSAGR